MVKHTKKIPFIKTLLLLCCYLLLHSSFTQAFEKIAISDSEYNRWPRYCQATSEHADVPPPNGQLRPTLGSNRLGLIWKVGVWHYCVGLIKIVRAERTMSVSEADKGIFDALSSYNKTPKYEYLATEMAVTIARGYRIKKDYVTAEKYLQIPLRFHPNYEMTYSVLSSIYFDKKEYLNAINVLIEGNDATGGKSAEINYFLGLAYANIGNIKMAKEQSIIAKSLGYPLLGLDIKIASIENGKR